MVAVSQTHRPCLGSFSGLGVEEAQVLLVDREALVPILVDVDIHGGGDPGDDVSILAKSRNRRIDVAVARQVLDAIYPHVDLEDAVTFAVDRSDRQEVLGPKAEKVIASIDE